MKSYEQRSAGEALVLVIAKPGRIGNSLQVLVNSMPGLKVVGLATNYISAMHMMIHYHPALVLLDGDLPDNQAWAVLQQMQLKQPRTPCLFFVSSIQQQRAARAAGARAALLKGFEAAELFSTIETLLPQL